MIKEVEQSKSEHEQSQTVRMQRNRFPEYRFRVIVDSRSNGHLLRNSNCDHHYRILHWTSFKSTVVKQEAALIHFRKCFPTTSCFTMCDMEDVLPLRALWILRFSSLLCLLLIWRSEDGWTWTLSKVYDWYMTGAVISLKVKRVYRAESNASTLYLDDVDFMSRTKRLRWSQQIDNKRRLTLRYPFLAWFNHLFATRSRGWLIDSRRDHVW